MYLTDYEVTIEDIDKDTEYMKENFNCMEMEKTCGTYIGCSGCPYEQFKRTVLSSFEEIKKHRK